LLWLQRSFGKRNTGQSGADYYVIYHATKIKNSRRKAGVF
jgi:hypothetical protein